MWKIVVSVEAKSLEKLKYRLLDLSKQVFNVSDYRHIPVYGGHGTGDDPGGYYQVTLTCPIETEIKELRQRADDLEKKLLNAQ